MHHPGRRVDLAATRVCATVLEQTSAGPRPWGRPRVGAPEDYGAEGNRMFVTCGIGFSVIPARINAPPQVAFFELRPGE